LSSYVFVLVVGLIAGSISGIVGSGGSIMLMPLLVYQFGPQQAVPIMAIAGLLANFGKATAWWKDVNWRLFAVYSATSIPAAALGAKTLLTLPASAVETALGGFFILMIPVRRWMKKHDYRIRAWQLALAGAGIGFLSGIVSSTGPLSIPVFVAAGLMKGALLSTEALASIAILVSKVTTFSQLGALPWDVVVQGAIIGLSVMAGTYVGKFFVLRMSLHHFELLLDGLLAVSGASLLLVGLAHQ